MMRRLAVAVGFSWVVAVTVAHAGEPFPAHEFLSAGDLPPNFRAEVVEIKPLGRVVIVSASQPERSTRAVVTVENRDLIENRDLSSIPARRAAVKGYVNGLATTLANQGYSKIVAKSIPDLNDETLGKPIEIDLTLANAEGKEIFVHEQVFFTDKGFVVQVIADDEAGRKVLADWSRTVKPKPAPGAKARS